MEKSIVMNNEGKFGRSYKSGWTNSAKDKMFWEMDINKATLFTKLTEKSVDFSEVVDRIPAKETRNVEIIGEPS